MLANKYREASRISGCKETFLPNVFNKKKKTKKRLCGSVIFFKLLQSTQLTWSKEELWSHRVYSLKDPTLYHLLFVMVCHLLYAVDS